jgi:hypothetical protein
MMLARISPGPEGYDSRTFECAKCDHVLTLKVSSRPDEVRQRRVDRWRFEAARVDRPGERKTRQREPAGCDWVGNQT